MQRFNFSGAWAVTSLVALASIWVPAQAETRHRNTGFLDFNFYPFTRVEADNAVTINALGNLPRGLQYFSLTNFGRDPERAALKEFNNALTEQNLRWNIPGETPRNLFQLTAQALVRSGQGNDALRLGLRWKVHATPQLGGKLKQARIAYWIDVHAIQFDHVSGHQWQIEHVFRWIVSPNRVYIAGFADHNIDQEGGTKHNWVEETQLGIRLVDELHLIIEQRYNAFRKGDESSLGSGIEYVIRF